MKNFLALLAISPVFFAQALACGGAEKGQHEGGCPMMGMINEHGVGMFILMILLKLIVFILVLALTTFVIRKSWDCAGKCCTKKK